MCAFALHLCDPCATDGRRCVIADISPNPFPELSFFLKRYCRKNLTSTFFLAKPEVPAAGLTLSALESHGLVTYVEQQNLFQIKLYLSANRTEEKVRNQAITSRQKNISPLRIIRPSPPSQGPIRLQIDFPLFIHQG